MEIFSSQGKKLFKWTGITVLALLAAGFALWGGLQMVLNSLDSVELRGEAISPGGSYVLSLYDSYGPLGFQGGFTYFNLHRKNQRLKFTRRSLINGELITRDNDIVIADGNWFPYGIVWLDEKHLLIKAEHPPDYINSSGFSSTGKMFPRHLDRWEDVEVSYGILGPKPVVGEVRIQGPGPSLGYLKLKAEGYFDEKPPNKRKK